MAAPAGWYPDPAGSGGQRYFDGVTWTEHHAPPPWAPAGGPTWGAPPWGVPPWKGAELGRPAGGPGSLADPGRRLGARLLDGLILLPVLIALVAVAVALVAPHVGPLFPVTNPDNPNAQMIPTPGIIWIYAAVFGAGIVATLLSFLYEVVATARYGRTLGKRWLRIRPLRMDGTTVGWGRACGRAGIYWLSNVAGWLGFIDPLWCIWDPNRPCLHDKVADTIVVND